MDLVDYDKHVYNRIVEEYTDFISRLNPQHVTFIPVSALIGDNIVEKTDKMQWYDGPTLLHHLEHVNVGASQNVVDFRYPVQYVLRPNQNFRGYAGQVASGRITPGEEVVVFPAGLESRIKQIVTYDDFLDEANAGDSVTLTLEDDIDISRGDMIVRKGNLPQKSNEIDATVCWMSDDRLDSAKMYQLQHTTRFVRALITKINYRIDVDTMHREDAETLTLNEIGRIQLTTTQPLFYDRYALNRMTGSFILIDPATNNTVAAGMIRGESREIDDLLDVTSAEQEVRRQRLAEILAIHRKIARKTFGACLKLPRLAFHMLALYFVVLFLLIAAIAITPEVLYRRGVSSRFIPNAT
jgi:bifunctional enzyme CysN/CysC